LADRRFATRLNSFRERGSDGAISDDLLARVAGVPGISAVELNFPQHVRHDGAELFVRLADLGLAVTALNLRFDDRQFQTGAFTNPGVEIRQAAIRLCQDAVETAARNGVPHVILWLGPDGYDYPFQVDFAQLWAWEIEGLHRVAMHDVRTRVSIEYKPNDPRRVSLIRTMADSLLAVHDAGSPNLGVTLDVCHALMTGEQPAAAAALALRKEKLFGVHLNDGYGPADDGLTVGTIHPWQTLELLWELRRGGFEGTIYFDTFPERVDPAAETAANVDAILRFERLLDRIDPLQVRDIQERQDAIAAVRMLHGLMGE
jgi:xylose isomerase